MPLPLQVSFFLIELSNKQLEVGKVQLIVLGKFPLFGYSILQL